MQKMATYASEFARVKMRGLMAGDVDLYLKQSREQILSTHYVE